MELGVLEQKLRALPGVLDCSVSAEGVAVVVHPEVDPRLIEVQAQVLLAEAGDRRALLVVGGMTVGPRVLPTGPPPRARRPPRSGPSPLSLVAFVVLVLGLLAVVPIAGRDSRPDRAAAPIGQGGVAPLTPSGLGRLPVDDASDEIVVAAGPAVEEAPGPVDAEEGPTATVDLGTVRLASASSPTPGPHALPAPSVPSPTATVPGAEPAPFRAAGGRGAEAESKAESKAKADDKGRGGRRSGEVRAGGRSDTSAAAKVPPGKADPPGRRRGHHR